MINHHAITAIMACDEAGLIGRGNGLPDWGCPEDLAHFRATTDGHSLIMGRKTWDCLPASFRHNRACVVLSRQMPAGNAPAGTALTIVRDLAALPNALQHAPSDKQLFVIGGADLVPQLLPFIDRFILSRIAGRFKGDCCFPQAMLTQLDQWPVLATDRRIGFEIQILANPSPATLF